MFTFTYCSVNCTTAHNFGCSKFKFCTDVICVCTFLFLITVFSLHLVAIFIFSHLCPLLCNCLYQRLNVSVMYVLM